MKFKTLALIAAIIIPTFSNSYGFVHGQFLYGNGKGKFEGGTGLNGTYSNKDVGASIQFDYVKELPITFGVFFNSRDFRLRDTDSNINRIYTWSFGPEMMVYYPRFKFVPYAKAAIGFGELTALDSNPGDFEQSRARYSSSAKRVALGLKWNYKPMFAPIIEYQQVTEELDIEESTMDLSPNESYIFKSNTILFGFETSI